MSKRQNSKESIKIFSVANSELFSPEIESKGSLQRRIELAQVLKEADDFLKQPIEEYTPAQNPINIIDQKSRSRSPFKSIKTEIPKIQSVSEFVKERQEREKSNNRYKEELELQKQNFGLK